MSSAPSSLKLPNGFSLHMHKPVGRKTRVFGLLAEHHPYLKGWNIYIDRRTALAVYDNGPRKDWLGHVRADCAGYAAPLWVVFDLEETENEFGEVCP